jgi:hypothetical protein
MGTTVEDKTQEAIGGSHTANRYFLTAEVRSGALTPYDVLVYNTGRNLQQRAKNIILGVQLHPVPPHLFSVDSSRRFLFVDADERGYTINIRNKNQAGNKVNELQVDRLENFKLSTYQTFPFSVTGEGLFSIGNHIDAQLRSVHVIPNEAARRDFAHPIHWTAPVSMDAPEFDPKAPEWRYTSLAGATDSTLTRMLEYIRAHS